jgi:hypothetical protein
MAMLDNRFFTRPNIHTEAISVVVLFPIANIKSKLEPRSRTQKQLATTESREKRRLGHLVRVISD